MTVEGHALDDVVLGGWAYGPELGTAPVVVVVGGITASPFPLGDGQAAADERARGVVAGALRARPDRSRRVTPCSARAGRATDRRGAASTTAAAPPAISVLGPRRSGGGVARRLRLHDAGHLRRREPRRHGRRRVRRAPSRAVRPADRDLGGPAARRLGHGDAPPAARAGARRPAQRRRRHRHEPRAPDRHADLPRPRRARHALRQAGAGARAAAGRRVSRTSRPPLRRAVPGQDVPAPQRSRSIAARSAPTRRALRAALERSPPRRSSSACPATCCFPWALQVELHRELQAAGAQSSLWKLDSVYGHDAFLADQDRLAELLRGAGAFGGELRAGAAAALRGRRRRAGARAAHRHGRLRHRRRAACSR